jgi:hypothetical protein
MVFRRSLTLVFGHNGEVETRKMCSHDGNFFESRGE